MSHDRLDLVVNDSLHRRSPQAWLQPELAAGRRGEVLLDGKKEELVGKEGKIRVQAALRVVQAEKCSQTMKQRFSRFSSDGVGRDGVFIHGHGGMAMVEYSKGSVSCSQEEEKPPASKKLFDLKSLKCSFLQ